MPKRPEPREFEPEWLQRSLDRYLAWGLGFMFILVIAFPLYHLREPTLRAEAKASQEKEYLVQGADLFDKNCSSCHGKQATGGTAPTLNSKQFLTTTSDQQMQLLITGGVSGSSMVAWSQDYGGSLTAEQIKMLTTYLRSLEPNAPSIPDWRTGAKAGG
jgi:mono/diheme cytochrome c family protein